MALGRLVSLTLLSPLSLPTFGLLREAAGLVSLPHWVVQPYLAATPSPGVPGAPSLQSPWA